MPAIYRSLLVLALAACSSSESATTTDIRPTNPTPKSDLDSGRVGTSTGPASPVDPVGPPPSGSSTAGNTPGGESVDASASVTPDASSAEHIDASGGEAAHHCLPCSGKYTCRATVVASGYSTSVTPTASAPDADTCLVGKTTLRCDGSATGDDGSAGTWTLQGDRLLITFPKVELDCSVK